MIHFTCDCCGQPIDTDQDTRYVVRLEVYPAVEESASGFDDGDENQLEEIAELLERGEELADACPGADSYQSVRYDLCEACRATLSTNPLARLAAAKIGFSEN